MRSIVMIAALMAMIFIGAGGACAGTEGAKPLAKPAHKPVAAARAASPAAKPAAQKTPAPVTMADTKDGASGLPVPRFVTLGADEVNLRTGPGFRYPIRVVFRKTGLPVEITREFDVWRQIRDKSGDEGWVHKSMLSGKRAVIVAGGTQTLLAEPKASARPVVRLETGVIAALSTCKGEWCRLKIASYDGWLKRADVWGVYQTEAFQE